MEWGGVGWGGGLGQFQGSALSQAEQNYILSTCTATWGLEYDLFDSLQNTPLTGIIF